MDIVKANEVVSLKKYEIKKLSFNIPKDLVYSIEKGAVDFYSSVYDLFAKELGISFGNVKKLQETMDYIEVEMSAFYFNKNGEKIMDTVIYAIDTKALYKESRLKWMPEKWEERKAKDGGKYDKKVVDEKKVQELRDKGFLADEIQEEEDGTPMAIKRRLPPDVEREKYLNFLNLQKNKLQKAQTCARRTLIKRAIAMKGYKFPSDWGGKVRDISIELDAFLPKVGFKEGKIEVQDDFHADEVLDPQREEEVSDCDEPEEEPNGGEQSNLCEECGAEVSDKVRSYSLKSFKKVLCYDDQSKVPVGK